MSKKLGDFIRKARTAKKLTQAALAGAVVGLTAADISKIERGEKEPEEAVLRRMAKPLGVTQTALIAVSSYAVKKAVDAKKTSSSAAKTSGAKTTAAKTAAAKKTSTARKTSSADALKLTATEKKLVELYRKSDTATKKSVVSILEGKAGVAEYAALLMKARAASSSGKEENNSTLNQAFSVLESTFGKLIK